MFELTRAQDWRFGDILAVHPVGIPVHDNRRWILLGYDGKYWMTMYIGPSLSAWAGTEYARTQTWDDMKGFELVESGPLP